MATVTEFTLKKDGTGDYTTISAFLAAQVNGVDFVSLDVIRRLKVFKAGWNQTTPLTESFLDFGSGTTTSATQRPEIVCDGAETHDFTPDTGFVMKIDTSFGFVARSHHILIDGIELYNCSNTNSLWFAGENVIFNNSLSYSHTSTNISFGGVGNNLIFFDYPNSTNNSVCMANAATLNNSVGILRAGQGYLDEIAFRATACNDSLIYKEQPKVSYSAYFACSGDYNGVNRTGEDVPGANSVITLLTTDFADFANDDYRIKAASPFATAGSGGGLMGAAIEAGGGAVTVTVNSTMPSMISAGFFSKTDPATVLSASIISLMPSMTSTGNFTQSVPGNSSSISSTMPSMVSAALFNQSVPEFNNSIVSTMPGMVSSAIFQNLAPGNSSSILSSMPSMISSATFTIEDPKILDAAIISVMPSMQSSATFFNGIINIVIGEGNNIDIVVKSRNIDIESNLRNINIKTKSRNI